LYKRGKALGFFPCEIDREADGYAYTWSKRKAMLYPLTGTPTCCVFARLGLTYGASRTVIIIKFVIDFVQLIIDFVKLRSIASGCFSQAAKAIKPSHPRFGATAPIHEPATAHIVELLADLYRLRLSYL
jgi:hypothetical protein